AFIAAYPRYRQARRELEDSKTDDAMRDLRETLRVDPRFCEALNALGAAWIMRGNLSQAQENLRKAVALDPRFALAWLNLARVYGREKQASLARSCYARAAASIQLTEEAAFLLPVIQQEASELPTVQTVP